MNVGQSYDIQWIQQSPHDVDSDAAIIVNGGGATDDGVGGGPEDAAVYLDDGSGHPADLDQIAAENLIFMARDGQMTDIIPTGTDEHGAVIVAAGDGTRIDVMQQAGGMQRRDTEEDDACFSVEGEADFSDCTPQMVTEEVITDDWVQHQGEDRVEIAAEQIIGSGSQVLLDMEVPLPTDQDQYTVLRPYPCDFCNRRFRKKLSLVNHMVAHKNDRPHLCKLCGSRFFRKSELIDHLKAHASASHEQDDYSLAEPENRSQLENSRFYDEVWEIHDDDSPDGGGSNVARKSIGRNKSELTAEPAFHPTMPGQPGSSGGTQRGRISRLKPKEEQFGLDGGPSAECPAAHLEGALRDERLPSSEMDYVDCSTAAVKLTQDQSPAHQKHYPIIDNSKPFVCQECGLAFSREKALLAHTKQKHQVDSSYECSQCQEVFWDVAGLQDHQKTHQFEESNSEYDPEADDSGSEYESEQAYGEFYCSECGLSFHRQDLLKRHAKVHEKGLGGGQELPELQSGARHCCNTCGETFAEALDLLAHAEIHARYPSFKCILCGESFFEEVAIKRHLLGQHYKEMTPNSCILCGKSCRDRKALIKHAWDHSREKCHSCPKCGKKFLSKGRLKRHMDSHRDKSVVCDVCHEEFPDGRSLSNHRHSHSANSASGKMFPCHECGKTFGSRSSQQIHVRIHTGERPYGCRFCYKAFADGGTLRKHERIHTGEKPYACSVCPKAFNQRVVLRDHIRSHHSGLDAKRGTYHCTVCSEDLPSSNSLMQHLIQHSDTNTAKQRQPVTGPRKYKRRRKLKPHEIARMRSEYKRSGNGSDLDICDFDMENVDELLGLAAVTSTSSASGGGGDKKAAGGKRAAATKRTRSNNNSHTKIKSSHSDDEEQEEALAEPHATDADGELIDVMSLAKDPAEDCLKKSLKTEKMSPQKGGGSSKMWQASNDLLSTWEQAFMDMDSSLVASDGGHNGVHSAEVPPAGKKYKYKSEEGSSQRTQQVERIKADPKGPSKGRVRKADRLAAKATAAPVPARPRMIHTERWMDPEPASSSSSAGKRRPRSYVTRTEPSAMQLLAATKSSIVNDYEIISPESQVPSQISSSPVHIKQENAPAYQPVRYDCLVTGDATSTGELLLGTPPPGRRKTAAAAAAQYDPSIVNDLEEILQSPIKAAGSRQPTRYSESIESSPQFLVDDQQHFIKIEPTSPDLRDIVVSTSSSTASGGAASHRRSTRATRQRLNPSNRKYQLDYGGDLHTSTGRDVDSSVVASSSAAAEASRSSKSRSRLPKMSSAKQYLDYEVSPLGSLSNGRPDSAGSMGPVGVGQTPFGDLPSGPALEPRQTYFECEMCTQHFPDRAQLLDHVPVHI